MGSAPHRRGAASWVLLGLAIFSLRATHARAERKGIALTFDDAPRTAHGYFSGPLRAKKLIAALRKARVREAAFFAVSSGLDDEGRARLDAYARAGHLIANHGHAHLDFNVVEAADYVRDFETADGKLRDFSTFVPWFRFPYLREGNDEGKRDGMRAALARLGYRNAYVTVNTYDWYMEDQFQKAVASRKKPAMAKLRSFYVGTLMKAVAYYEGLAQRQLGRSPEHVMLLHETDLNALFVGDLVSALEAAGWTIVSPREAYDDELADYTTSSVFKFNPGRVGEIARDKGQREGLWDETCDEAYLDREFERQVLPRVP